MSVTFRKVIEQDRKQIEEWIAADPIHAGVVDPNLLLDGKGVASVYAIEDAKGTVMYVRQEPEENRVRIHIQFCPSHRRSIQALQEGYPIVRTDARNRGFKQIVFDSSSPALIRCVLGMGFRAELLADI